MVVLVELALLRVLLLLAAVAVLADILALVVKAVMLVHRVLLEALAQEEVLAVVVEIHTDAVVM
jgi:hypothetical protein